MFWGCSTYNTIGNYYDTTAIDRIELGKTKESEVIAMLGAPGSTKKTDNGIVIYYYFYGYQKGLGADSSVDSLEIQLFNGVVIKKSQTLTHFR
jgi:outer membrane protein assembly factor BamE (lipoprotein component of BamABCDE complex)